MYLFVGSTNPVKINALKLAAESLWSELIVSGYEVDSGVPAQPWGDEQTRLGAENRAKRALELGLEKNPQPHDHSHLSDEGVPGETFESIGALGIGMEGGVVQIGDELWATVWAAVADANGRVVVANGSRFSIPTQIAEPIKLGGEMGPVVATLANIEDIKKKQGMIGLVTNNYVTRTDEYSSIVKMALGLWYGQVKPWQT